MFKARLCSIALLFVTLQSIGSIPASEPEPLNDKRNSAKHSMNNKLHSFLQELIKYSSVELSDPYLEQLLSEYDDILAQVPEERANANKSKSQNPIIPSLEELKLQQPYRESLAKLFRSSSPNKRILAYLTIAATNDTFFIKIIVPLLKSERNDEARHHAARALLYLRADHARDLFDYLVKFEDLRDSYLVVLYLRFDKTVLRDIASEKLRSRDLKDKILALRMLAVCGLNTTETDKLIREALTDKRSLVQDYALTAVISLHMEHLKKILLPLLANAELRSKAIEALAQSRTREDQDYAAQLKPGDIDVSSEVLKTYFKSNKVQQVQKWLELVRDKRLPQDYVFYCYDQPLISSDQLLPDVRNTLRNTKNRRIVVELIRALERRNDDESVNLLIQLLSDPDKTIRDSAAAVFRYHPSPKLVPHLAALIRNPKTRSWSLTDLAIRNRIDGLQDLYVPYLTAGDQIDIEWRRYALNYLSVFPRPEYKQLFKSTLQNDSDYRMKEFAANGLGELKDRSCVDLIIGTMRKDSLNDDRHYLPYIQALGKIKGAQSRQAIESFRKSESDEVRKAVAELLQKW